MAKEIAGIIKLQIKGGAANPSPPVGPALGSKGVNIMQFCKQFNARTQDQAGKVLPVLITVFADKSFEFIVKQPPVAVQVLEAAKVNSGSAEPHVKKVGTITWDQVKEIAEIKNLSFHTINTHRKNIFRKLSINSISQLVKYAINNGILTEIEYYI